MHLNKHKESNQRNVLREPKSLCHDLQLKSQTNFVFVEIPYFCDGNVLAYNRYVLINSQIACSALPLFQFGQLLVELWKLTHPTGGIFTPAQVAILDTSLNKLKFN